MNETFKHMPGRPLILVNEGDPNMNDLLTQILQAEGYRVVVGKDGQQAVKLAQSLLPDLIIMNTLLEKKFGNDVNAELKADPRTSTIKVLLLSTKKGHESLSPKPDAFIEKPFDVHKLLEAVVRLVGPPPEE